MSIFRRAVHFISQTFTSLFVPAS